MGYIIHAENTSFKFFASADVSDVAFSHALMAGVFSVSSDATKNFIVTYLFDRFEFLLIELIDWSLRALYLTHIMIINVCKKILMFGRFLADTAETEVYPNDICGPLLY
jgi:hypothetical protein